VGVALLRAVRWAHGMAEVYVNQYVVRLLSFEVEKVMERFVQQGVDQFEKGIFVDLGVFRTVRQAPRGRCSNPATINLPWVPHIGGGNWCHS
jgi:hypothetical protein